MAMNLRRLKIDRIKQISEMVEEGKTPKEIMEKLELKHRNQYYRALQMRDKYSDIL